jgi:hypothetical protein
MGRDMRGLGPERRGFLEKRDFGEKAERAQRKTGRYKSRDGDSELRKYHHTSRRLLPRPS